MSLLIALVIAAIIQAPATPDRATLTGQVLEEGTNAPIAGAQVNVMRMPTERPPQGSIVAARPFTATTDREGRFQVGGLEPGRYRVSVQKAGFAMPLDAGVPPLDLAAGEPRSVEIALQRGAVIVGRVLDEAGEPLADARVMAMRKMPAGTTGASTGPGVLRPAGPSAQSNDLGEFRLFSLPPGEYVVQAMPRPDFGAASGPRTRTLLPTFFPSAADQAGAESITVGAGQTSDALVITMIGAPAYQVSGIVVDESGKPVANAMIRLSQEDAGRGPAFMMMRPWNQGRTDATGRFSLSHVTPGPYTLLAIAPELIAGSGSAAASVSATTWSAINPGISGSIGGGVTTETNNGVTIQYRDDQGTRVAITIAQTSVENLQVTVRLPARQE